MNGTHRGLVLVTGCLLLAVAGPGKCLAATSADGDGEVLYNGIQLPKTWPPRLTELQENPVTPPYLSAPPAVIPIDVGRQLLVDDFLIAQTTLQRVFHRPEYFSENPVLTPDMPWGSEIRNSSCEKE